EVESIACVAGEGLWGDRFFGFKENYKGQVTFFEIEVYQRLREQLKVTACGPGVFRRNIVVRGVDLNTLIGREFELQGVRFYGVEECSPCHWMNQAFGEGAMKALRGHGGLRARVLTDGVLRCELSNAAVA
ncbi:MAG: MOSC domain-containing protein, partial [Roseimicrobium sp.]